jgi:molecular chaperone GrpE (heat shock protein)
MLAAFAAAGVEFAEGVGMPFDPHVHRAVEARPAPGIEPDLIVEVTKRGCRRHGELLRLAEVIVAE